jgi:hypothetical protein
MGQKETSFLGDAQVYAELALKSAWDVNTDCMDGIAKL